ncbi:MAG TPA: hypothetical protein VGC94_07710 [Amnibacterium sp.]
MRLRRWQERRRPVVVLAALALLGTVLTSCSAPNDPGPSPTATALLASPSASAAPAPPTPTAVPPTAPASAPPVVGAGCPRTAATMPAGVASARIVDVDGDGHGDREWARILPGGTVRFGITTASGATVSAEQQFAGGGDRTVVVGRLASGVVVAIPSEGRDSPLWSFVRCVLHPVAGTYDPQVSIGGGRFVFYSADDAGAVGCLHGELEGFHSIDAGRDRVTFTAVEVTVSADGLHATTGATRTVLKDAKNATMSDYRRIAPFTRATCGSSPVLRPVFSGG